MAFALPSRAYDLKMLDRPADRARDQGWVYGLPPGIGSEQWPLDPVTGYPLMHGFTLLLPEDYRVHGEDIVAVSFFATPADHTDGGATDVPEIRAAVMAQPSHPRLSRMTDILDYEYAALLLTRSEYEGPFATPPAPLALATADRPRWLDVGGASAFFETAPPFAQKMFAGPPRAELAENLAIALTPRADDPNAGKAPQDPHIPRNPPTGYQSYYYFEGGVPTADNYRLHDWAKDHAHNHLGGTMRPCQAVPEMSPFYIEFEEYLGGYNFGTGNAQFDFRDMKFDWACG
ncbi:MULTISPECIES: hypothetical protein [Bradyrhizobium]|uniref:DUF1963 domain-containing protein n=1 Tax=Bradyrhizobium ottawaense TaxID=931866 RepID=A0ABV4FPB9_9BRAD|nr:MULTISPECIES: hypothetical protein [Bradyrhizobium]MBR1292928.1 hypothetical protein [Bradyrhizobium ottawaense]MDA9414301.1 hypothetical protein [Bradyrhizobium sp. CCBAU 25360]MDA9481668.1 hypothetical protein [Bradyrhizobium sp. CCBAU 11445]WLB46043.1 hypothetical protein QIH93_37160 [Bradyrhizobium ottawaense]WQN83373.1 hypothetical protein U7859_02505 [Bradyrhizobium ottawaense]